MKKIVLFFGTVLLVLFAAITVLKSQRASVEPPPDADAPTGAEAADVQRFWTRYRQATEHRMAGRWEAAAAAYREALALNDRHEDALYYLGNMDLERGDFDKARQAWERLAALNPNSARAHARLGDLYLCSDQDTLRDLDAAEAAFTRAMDLNKEETGPLLRLGQLALIQGDLTEAQAYFEAVTGSNYKSVEAHFLGGYVAWKQGAARQAAARFAEAARHAQPEAPPQGVLGEGDTKTGTGPLVSAASGCRLFQPYLDDLTPSPEATPAPSMDQRYQALDRFLEQMRAKFAERL